MLPTQKITLQFNVTHNYIDVNGNNRSLFEKCDYVGLDVIEGNNVDIVCVAHNKIKMLPII